MGASTTEPWAGLLSLATLLLWPGLLIVHAPWRFVPFLSLSFWLVSWDWLTPTGPGRHRFLLVCLTLSVLLSGLRLLKPLGASRPSWPSLVVLAAALGRLAPFFLWPSAPGLDPAFSTSSVQLLAWRDGLPASYLPLYPILGFGLGDSGLAALAADVSLLAGVPPPRAFLLATLAAEGLLTLAFFAFVRRVWPQSWASLGAVTLAALASGAYRGEEGGVVLALALAIAGAALVLHASGRSTRVAAGALWAGGVALSVFVVAAGALATAAALAKRGSKGLVRFPLAALAAILLAAPVVLRMVDAGSLTARPILALAIALVIVVGIPLTAGRWSWPEPKAWVLAACAGLAILVTLADWRQRVDRVLVSADALAAAAWLQDHSEATDVVCASDEVARAWIPALAGRAASPPRWPGAVQPSRLGPPLAACRFVWQVGGSELEPAFRQGRVSVTRLSSSVPGGP